MQENSQTTKTTSHEMVLRERIQQTDIKGWWKIGANRRQEDISS